MRTRLAWLISLVWLLVATGVVQADDEFAASFRLRGGYDTNPVLVPHGRGAAFATVDGAFAAGRETESFVAGVVGEGSFTQYRGNAFAPAQNYKLRLQVANKGQNDVALSASTAITNFSNYDTRSADLTQRVRAQWTGGPVRPFVSAELRLASLNESNPLLGDFLPAPMRYLRGTVTPGVAYRLGKFEAGVSFALSQTKYEEEFDLFGFRRDSRRTQPFVFARYEDTDLEISGAVSLLRGRSEDIDFTDVRAPLFEFALTYNFNPWTIELAAARTAEDTTFPVSPVTINTTLFARLTRHLDDKTRVAAFGRYFERDYWDTPFESSVRAVGFEFVRVLADDFLLGVELAYAHSTLISGGEAEAAIASVGLMRRFGGDPKRLRAGANPAR